MMIDEFGEESGSSSSFGSVNFLPMGEDSWSYRCGRYWVSVRRDLAGHFPAAYEGTLLLRESGKEFVLAPLRGRSGRIVHTVDGFPVVVFPYLARAARGTANGTGITAAQLDSLVRRLEEVHRSDLRLRLPVEDFRPPFEKGLEEVLAIAASGVGTGPMSQALHRLVSRRWDHLQEQLREFSVVATSCADIWQRSPDHVLTHGDPSRANVLLTEDVLILDWGGLMWSPPERDWSAISRHFGVPPRGRAEMLRFYELRWNLGEIAEYVTRFVNPHTGDADDQAMWQRLVRYV